MQEAPEWIKEEEPGLAYFSNESNYSQRNIDREQELI